MIKHLTLQILCTILALTYFFSLNIKAHTWTRDSHGLYDYECLQVIRNTLKVENNSFLVRYDSEVKVISAEDFKQLESMPFHQIITKLASITLQNGNFLYNALGKFFVSDLSIKPIYEESLDKLWLINRSGKSQLQQQVFIN